MILFILGALILSTLIIQEPIKILVSAENTEQTYEIPPDPECLNVISDTNFTDTPNYGTNGTTNEFSAKFLSNTIPSVFNYVELRWEHTPGGSLQLRNDYSGSDQEPAT